jgi:drug/metabolite transporter (DMT)-like permease
MLGLHFATWISSLAYTSVAVSTLLVTTTPLWTELYDVVRERRAPSRAYLLSLALALGGVAALVFAHSHARPPIAGLALLGDGLALAGSVAIGAYLLIVRAVGSGAGGTILDTGQIVARTYTWAALALTIAALLGRQPPPPLGDTRAWAGILAMALVSQLLGHTALNASLRDFSPSVVAMTTLLEPVIAALLAALLFGESLSLQSATGAVLVLGAVAVTLLSAQRRQNYAAL